MTGRGCDAVPHPKQILVISSNGRALWLDEQRPQLLDRGFCVIRGGSDSAVRFGSNSIAGRIMVRSSETRFDRGDEIQSLFLRLGDGLLKFGRDARFDRVTKYKVFFSDSRIACCRLAETPDSTESTSSDVFSPTRGWLV